MGERIAVTGANGFVGRHLIVHAVARRLDVVGVVRSEEGSRVVREAGGVPAKIDSLEADALARAFEGARAVVHLAQIGSEHGSATYEAVNVQGTKAVIAAATATGVPRVVYFSGLGVARYGMAPRTTNPYFLSKLSAEVALFRSDRAAVVFRPSYIVGSGDAFVPAILREMATGTVERPGDGSFRLQPIFVRDAVELVLAAILRPPSPGRDGRPRPSVFDLVGPEVVSYQQFLDRVARVARAQGRKLEYRVREVPIAEIDRQAAAGGYRGKLADEVDCLLCDEVSDPAPLEALLGRFLTPLDDAVAAAVRSADLP